VQRLGEEQQASVPPPVLALPKEQFLRQYILAYRPW
jgi:hypothetical protein